MNELFNAKKIKLIFSLILSLFLIILVILFILQVICGSKYQKLASNNSIRLIPLKAKRGVICDRNGEILVDSVPALYAAFYPKELKSKENFISTLSHLLSVKEEAIKEQIELNKQFLFEPIKLKELNDRELAILSEHLLQIPGIFIEEEPKRFYPYKNLASHLLGYLGQIDEKELSDPDYFGYKTGSLIGQTGIEKDLESYLRGKNGGKQILVDARGRFIKILGSKLPYPGNRVYLTIDKEIQQKAEEALGDQAGTIIVSNPKTGEILAMASHPSFDPNIFVNPLKPKDLARLHKHPQSPFLNRATQCAYPPGSIFKIITAVTALEKDVVSSRKEINCPGFYKLGKKKISCWKEEGHGPVNFLSAVEQSCNVYFFHLVDKLDVDDLNLYGRSFGLGKKTGINLPYEQQGILPSRKWKKEIHKENWYQGETLNLSIGQGYISATPIQILDLISAVANEGTIYQPQLIKKIISPEGKLIKDFKPKQLKNFTLKPHTWRLVKDGLRRVINGKHGTGMACHLENVEIAGKTGTAQVVKKKTYEDRKKENIPYRFRNHAWFVGFAPFFEPEVAVVVLIEHGGQGGVDAAPVAREIFKSIFAETDINNV